MIETSSSRFTFYLLLVVTCATLVMQTRSLAVFPIANATRWYSDESWVMEESQTQFEHGVVIYPHARASTLAYSKGLLLGTTWVSALLYGLPVVLSPSGSDIVLIGRIVSLALSILTLIALFFFLRKLGAPDYLALLAALIVVSTRANFIASHCARPDILAGFVVLLVIGYFALLRKRAFMPSSALWWFGFGLIIMALAWTSSVHLLTLLGPLAIWIMFGFGAFKRPAYYFSAIAGALIMASILATIYFVSTSGITLLGSNSHGVQFDSIIGQTPILRPFSRSVQVANIVIRLKLFASEAPAVLALAMLDILLFLFLKVRTRNAKLFSSADRFVFSSTIVVLLSWLYLQLASVTYTTHILSLVVFALTLLLNSLIATLDLRKNVVSALLIAGIVLGYIGWSDASTAEANGAWLSNNNHEAIQTILKDIKNDWQLLSSQQPTYQKPLVLVETPALHEIQKDTAFEVMTDHFAGFRTSSASLLDVMKAQHVNYVVLYNSDHYPKNRYTDDDFFMTVVHSSALIAKEARPLFDMGTDYFDSGHRAMDTLSLFRMPR